MIETFYAILEKHPDSWETRLILADWFEENGMADRTEGQRWQVENKRHAGFKALTTLERWDWFHELDGTDEELDVNRLPDVIFFGLKSDWTDTQQEADLVLSEQLAKQKTTVCNIPST